MMQDKSDELIGPEALAEYLGIPLLSIYIMNSKGTGPRRIKIGKHVRYRRTDVDAWLNGKAIESASVG